MIHFVGLIHTTFISYGMSNAGRAGSVFIEIGIVAVHMPGIVVFGIYQIRHSLARSLMRIDDMKWREFQVDG